MSPCTIWSPQGHFISWRSNQFFHRGCTCTVLRTVQSPGVGSPADGRPTVQFKESFKLFDKSIGHSYDFEVSSVAIS